ncbi:MAG: alpha/beta fold hydrolase [Acidimicrobiales bacterium]|nr:alpha/beta fold hydrolase [Acidimicrobiales bacterium]
METFTNDGFTFEVTDSGPSDGEVIVLLHGFPESRSSWREVAPRLAHAGYRVLAPNQRGYSRGARPKPRRAYTLDKLAGDVLALADQAGATRFHVVGHDWGGIVAWHLAAAHTERLLSLTSLATPHGRAMVKSLTRSTQGLKSWYMVMFQLPGLAERGFTSPARKRMRAQLAASGLSEQYLDEYMSLFAEPGAARGAINYYRALPLGPRQLFSPITVPTMYVYGTNDFALGRKAADLTGDYVTGPYRYEVLDGVSHWIPEEVPTRTSELVLDFLGSLRP